MAPDQPAGRLLRGPRPAQATSPAYEPGPYAPSEYQVDTVLHLVRRAAPGAGRPVTALRHRTGAAGPSPAATTEELVCTRRPPVTHDVRTFVLPRRGAGSSASGRPVPHGLRWTPRRASHWSGATRSPRRRPDRSRAITSSARPAARCRTGSTTTSRRRTRPVSGPLGDFTLDAHPATRHLFLSAGSGTTPMMSMARTLHDLGAGPRHHPRAQRALPGRHRLP